MFQEQIESLGLRSRTGGLARGHVFTKGTHSKCMRQVYIHFKKWSEDEYGGTFGFGEWIEGVASGYDGTNYWRIHGVEYKVKMVMRRRRARCGTYEFVDEECIKLPDKSSEKRW